MLLLDVCEDATKLWTQSPRLYFAGLQLFDKLLLNTFFMQITDKSSSLLQAQTVTILL